jgi:hypothetical protein
MNKTKEIYLTIRLVVDANADSQDIVDTLDYNIDHDSIRETEITDWES